MGKPRQRQITDHVRRTQNEITNDGFEFIEGDPLGGKCQTNNAIAQHLKGQTFDTREKSNHGPWGHTVAVVSPKGTNKAIVIDVTQENPIVGEVLDVRSPETVALGLRGLFGVGGWGRRK